MEQVNDPKRLVAQGYDRIGRRYGEQAGIADAKLRQKYIAELTNRVPKDASLLDLGCGSGVPTTKALAEHFTVTGVDISMRQIERARYNIPNATFICSDMAEAKFSHGSFDAVTAFYSIIHLPRDEQFGLLVKIAAWLRSEGIFVATMGARGEEVGYEDDWLGAPMYWSAYDSRTNTRLVEDAGLNILSAREETTKTEDGKETFLWIVTQKP